ncbi:MAG: hypothetical protein AAGC97_03260 [Planctomycetota bacterium]
MPLAFDPDAKLRSMVASFLGLVTASGNLVLCDGQDVSRFPANRVSQVAQAELGSPAPATGLTPAPVARGDSIQATHSSTTLTPHAPTHWGPTAAAYERFKPIVASRQAHTQEPWRPASRPAPSISGVSGSVIRSNQFANIPRDSAPTPSSRPLAAGTAPPTPARSLYLPTQTAKSQLQAAQELLQQARVEYTCGAFASAEEYAWQALDRAAQSIDLFYVQQEGMSSQTDRPLMSPAALDRLSRGRTAIREASDFHSGFATADELAVVRIARAHRTPVIRQTLPYWKPSRARPQRLGGNDPGWLDPETVDVHTDLQFETELPRSRQGGVASGTYRNEEDIRLPTAAEAIDRYLDYARSELSFLASESLNAAETMDLLAAIRLGRADSTQLPGPTAICLRRAAVQGQRSNADLAAKLGHHLADVGLLDEASWALRHSLSIQDHPVHRSRLAIIEAQKGSAQGGPPVMTSAPQPFAHVSRRMPDVTALSPESFAAISSSVMSSTNDFQTAPPSPVMAQSVSASPTTKDEDAVNVFRTASHRFNETESTQRPPTANQTHKKRGLPIFRKWW